MSQPSDLNLRRSRGTLGDPVQVRGQVSLTGIEDGCVGICNTTSSLQADVVSNGVYNGFVTYDITELNKTMVNNFLTGVILSGASTILSSEMVTSGRKFVVENINISGAEGAVFKLRVNGTQIGEFKNSGAMPSQSFIVKGIEAYAGDVVDILVTNCDDSSSSANFATGLNGYTIPTN